MGVPLSQMWTVATYVLGRKLRGQRRYPVVLMLEPLFRCNLACAGCGKIQYPADILKQHLTPEQCFRAVDECGAPMVSIPGGEPLLHPQIEEIVAGLVARRKYIYLCTNALLLEKHLHRFRPSKYLTFSIHLDGPRDEHDHAVCREGTYDVAIEAVRKALAAGFRVTTNTTLFNTADPDRFRPFFDELMKLGVEGMMISPGYSYEKAPDQQHFLKRRATVGLFQRLLARAPRRWKFNQSPLFLLFLQGRYDLECTPWGNPTYNLFGWQKPCYLMQEGYTQTFQELLDQTDWSQYGRASGNPKCADCMVHSGYEPSAVDATFGSWRGFLTTVKSVLLGTGGPAVAGSEHLPEVSPAEHLPVAEVVEGSRPSGGTRPQVELPVVQPNR
ncbi:MAG: adenosyl-hopene transferase HpnH [Planctomycetaceae bacterium]